MGSVGSTGKHTYAALTHQTRAYEAVCEGATCQLRTVQVFEKHVSTIDKGKITAGVFTGPQIRAVFSKDEFKKMLNMDQKNAWTSFQAVVDGFLGGKRDPNYKQLVETMLRNFDKMGCRMSHKLHILHSHLEVFKENSGRYSEEQGEYFHQEIKKLKNDIKARITQ